VTDEPIIPEVFVTKYALTSGIIRYADVIHCTRTSAHMIQVPRTITTFHGEGRDWHRTLEGAIARAEAMRVLRLMALRKQQQRLEGLVFIDARSPAIRRL
jgi:hypothetical protein